MQSKRISITFGANQDPVGISIKRLELSEGPGIYVIGIQPNSPAAKDGRLKVFDELLKVNDKSVRQYPYDQLKAIFTQRATSLKLVVYRNCSAAILHAIGYPIPNDNAEEDLEIYHSPCSSDPAIEFVELHSDLKDFGFFVAPGCGEYPVINHISPASQSELDNRLRIGDELMQVNDRYVRNIASQVVMELIHNSTDLRVKVRHVIDPLKTPTEMQPQVTTGHNHTSHIETIPVTLMRDSKGSLGIRIQGLMSPSIDGEMAVDDGIYIAKVIPDGPADLVGLVRKGDRIVEVNGNKLMGVTSKQAIRLVKMSGKQVSLVLERGHEMVQLEQACDRGSNASDSRRQEESSNNSNTRSTPEQQAVFPTNESVKSNSFQSGVSSIHGFYPSRLSEASLQFSHDPHGTMFSGVIPKEEKTRLVKEWQPRVGSEKIVKIAQITKYSPDGEIGLEINSQPVYQKNELSGMRTVISAISDGPAKEDGILLQGDEILEINGVRVTDVVYDDVVALLKATPQQVRLVVAGPHKRGEVPTHYLMNESSISSSEGESPSNTLRFEHRKKSYKSNKVRSLEYHSGNMTFPRQSARQGTMQTDLDQADNLILLKEIQEQKRKEQNEILEHMEYEKDKLERELFSKKELDNETKTHIKACLDRVQLKYETQTTLPRPSKYSKNFSYKRSIPNTLGQTSHSYLDSGIATTPRAPKSSTSPIPPRPTLTETGNTSHKLPFPHCLSKKNALIPDKSQVTELALSPNEADLLERVCVPFTKHDPTNIDQPLTLIPFPIATHSATTSDDESVHSPSKLSFPEMPRLPVIEQVNEQVYHSRMDIEPQDITVTKGDTLGIGIERQRDPKDIRNFKIIIHGIVPGSAPARDGRLKIGDELLSINSFDVKGKTKEEVALHITNLPRGPVVLSILHQQQNTLTKENKRDTRESSHTKHPPSLRTFTPVTEEKSQLHKIEKAFSLSTISDGSKIDFMGSRVTHSSSNSNNSLDENVEPYPLKPMSNLFPNLTKQNREWDYTDQYVEDVYPLVKSKSLQIQTRDEGSTNSLDEIPARFLDQDISVFTPDELTNNNTQKKSNHISPHLHDNEQYTYNNSPPIIPHTHKQQHYTPVVSERRQSIPRGVVREVHLSRKRDANLGISIVVRFIPGVREQSKGIFIKTVTNPILLSGQLEQDDQVLEVNGIDMNGFSHDQAVNLIKKASEPVILKLLHSPESVKRISLAKIANEHSELGGEIIHSYFVTGSKGSGIVVETARALNERVGRCYFKISEVLKRSSAEESKSIFKDDIIINVNGLNAVGIQHHQLVKLLNTPHCEVSIILCRPAHSTSPRDLSNNGKRPPSRARLYLKSCLIDKVHEVEIGVESKESLHHRPIIVISSIESKHPSFLEEIHPGDELVAINKKNLTGMKVENVQRWLYELRATPQYEISFYSQAPHSTSTSTGSAHSYEMEQTRPPSYSQQLSAQFTFVFYKEPRQDVGLLFVDGEVDGVYIEEVDPNGLAAVDQRVRPGCRVVAINDRNLLNDEASFVEMVLNGVIGQVSLTLETSFVQRIPRQHMEAHGYFRYSSEGSQDMSNSPQPPRSMPLQMHNIPTHLHNLPPQYHNMPPQVHNMSPQVHNMPQQLHNMPQQLHNMPPQLHNMPPQMHNISPQMHDMSDFLPKRGARIVRLFREGEKGFGLTLRGGANTSHGDLPLFVGKVYPHQAAFRSGQVHERDVILAINDISTTGMTCAEAVAVLKAFTMITLTLSDEKDPIAMVLPDQRNSGLYSELMSSRESLKSRDAYIPGPQNHSNPERKFAYNPYSPGHTPPMRYNHNVLIPAYTANMYPDWNAHYIPPHMLPPNEKHTELPPYELSQNYILKPDHNLIMVHLKSTHRGFGFSISGGVDNQSGPQPILIKSMTDDGAAKLDGNFAVGDEICAVNGYPLINVMHHQAVTILKQCQENLKPEQEVELLIRKRQV